jgi:hypothetical protein
MSFITFSFAVYLTVPNKSNSFSLIRSFISCSNVSAHIHMLRISYSVQGAVLNPFNFLLKKKGPCDEENFCVEVYVTDYIHSRFKIFLHLIQNC